MSPSVEGRCIFFLISGIPMLLKYLYRHIHSLVHISTYLYIQIAAISAALHVYLFGTDLGPQFTSEYSREVNRDFSS